MAAKNQEIIAAAIAEGATSTQYNTALMEFAIANGATAGQALPDALDTAFTSIGYTGTLQDKFNQWAAAGYPGAAPAYTYQLTVASMAGPYYGYENGVGGALDPTTAPHSDPDPITRMRADSANYFYVGVLGSHAGQSLWLEIEGFNDASTAVSMFGDVNQWYVTTAGLTTFMSGQVGNTIGVNLHETDPTI